MSEFLVQFVVNIVIFAFSVYIGVKLHDFTRSKHVAPVLARVKDSFKNNK